MEPAKIQYELKKRGITQKAIAREIGVAEMSVSKAIHRTGISDRIMKAVSRAIEQDHRYVFGEYYFGPKKRRTSKV